MTPKRKSWLRIGCGKDMRGRKGKREVQPWQTMIPGVKEAIIDFDQERPCMYVSVAGLVNGNGRVRTSKLQTWYPVLTPEVTIIITGTTIIAARLGERTSRVMSWLLCYSGMVQVLAVRLCNVWSFCLHCSQSKQTIIAMCTITLNWMYDGDYNTEEFAAEIKESGRRKRIMKEMHSMAAAK